jgi:hypothetical protein
MLPFVYRELAAANASEAVSSTRATMSAVSP